MLAIIADSASLSRRHLREAVAFAASQSIPLVTVATGELASEDYARNDATRCFHCKDELFTVLERERTARGLAHVVYGLNSDDTRDYRPGQQAASQHAVLAPLAEAGLSKDESAPSPRPLRSTSGTSPHPRASPRVSNTAAASPPRCLNK